MRTFKCLKIRFKQLEGDILLEFTRRNFFIPIFGLDILISETVAMKVEYRTKGAIQQQMLSLIIFLLLTIQLNKNLESGAQSKKITKAFNQNNCLKEPRLLIFFHLRICFRKFNESFHELILLNQLLLITRIRGLSLKKVILSYWGLDIQLALQAYLSYFSWLNLIVYLTTAFFNHGNQILKLRSHQIFIQINLNLALSTFLLIKLQYISSFMISRIFRSLQVFPRAFYSTQPKQNVVVVPKRHEVTFNQSSELQSYIKISPSCKALAALIKDNLQYFTDYHIKALFHHIGQYDLIIDEQFHTVIAPIAIEWVKTFTRAQAPTLCGILLALTYRNISSPQLQQVVVKKLDEEQIYRYLDLRETAAVFLSLSKHKRYVNHSLFYKIQKVIYQQKAYYSHYPDLLEAIREGMTAVEQQSGQKPLEIQQAYKQIV